MSYDIYLQIDTGKGMATVCDVGNYTSNIRGMLDEAFEREDWKYLEGYKCEEALPDIKKAIDNMVKDPEKFKRHNPSNGWGSYEGALAYMKTLLANCEDHPACKIHIDC